MNQTSLVLKALADETRMKLLVLLLNHNLCVRSLAKRLDITEAAVSQHLKVLRNAGLVKGEKRGYFMHYAVQREMLHDLAQEIEALAAIEPTECSQPLDCKEGEAAQCPQKGTCTDEQKEMCHGHKNPNRIKVHRRHPQE